MGDIFRLIRSRAGNRDEEWRGLCYDSSPGSRPKFHVFTEKAYPEGLTPAEMRTLLGVDKRLADTCLGMRRYGLLRRVERGRYVAAG